MLGDVPEPPVGTWLEADPGGRLMTWPICKVVGLMLGFAASSAATVVLNFAAMRVKVSPATMMYVEDGGGAGAGVGCGGGETFGTGVEI